MVCILATFFFSISLVGAAGTWWDTDWGYRMNDTLTDNYGDSLTRTPFILNGSEYYDTDALVSGGKLQSDCDDLRYVTGTQDGVLPYEWENKTSTVYGCNKADSLVWVSSDIPAGWANNSLYYGNAGGADGQNATGVWDINYTAVTHFREEQGTTAYDSLPGNLGDTLAFAGGQFTSAGKFGYGVQVDSGNSDYIETANNIPAYTEFTYEFWFYPLEVNLSNKGVWSKGNTTGSETRELILRWMGYSAGMWGCDAAGDLAVITRNASGESKFCWSEAMVVNTWYHIALRYNSSSAFSYFVNGEEVQGAVLGINKYAAKLYFGRHQTEYASARFDELRISDKARSNAEINASYYVGAVSHVRGEEEPPDATAPEITVLSPENTTYTTNNTMSFQVQLSEAGGGCDVDYNGTNHTMTNQSGMWNYSDDLANNNYTAKFYCDDLVGNMNSTTVSFEIDVPVVPGPGVDLVYIVSSLEGDKTAIFSGVNTSSEQWLAMTYDFNRRRFGESMLVFVFNT